MTIPADTVMASWSRLIRFLGEDGTEHYGEPVISDSKELAPKAEKGELEAEEFVGSNPFELKSTGKKIKVKEILPVLERKDVPTIRCIGLNFIKHIQEGGRQPPPYPSLFLKHNTSLAGWNEDVPVPKIAQDDQCDYEGELSIVIGKEGKDIPKEKAVEYIAGYCSSNDVSSRKWQRDPGLAGSVPQWCFSKGFDKYAPIGPMLASPKIAGSANNLQLQTWVNGEERQNSNTNDLLFDVPTIVSFLSQGTTLEPGTIIMTGTPSGVGYAMKSGPHWLHHGDIVEVEVEHCGRTKNKIVYV